MRRRFLRRLLYACAITAVITALAAATISGGFLGGFQRRASDAFFPSAKTDPRVVVVGLDSRTVAATGGQIPIPRSAQAELARQLGAAGAAVVVWDVLFSSPRDGDDDFRNALSELRAPVLGEDVTLVPSKTDDTLYSVGSVESAPLPSLASAGNTAVAQVKVIQDPSDGVVRVVPLVVEDHGRLVPSLTLAALRALDGEFTIRPNGVQVGHRFIPTEARHLLRLNFAAGLDKATDRSVVSAADVLSGAANPKQFRNKVVFIGATSTSLNDTLSVPVDKGGAFPGVMIHANALNTILTASYLTPVSETEAVLTVALLALLVSLSVAFLPVWLSLIFLVLVTIAFLLVSFMRFDDGHVMNIVYGLIAIALAFVAGLGIKYFTETRQRRRVSSLFAQYVPSEVAKQLEESGSIDAHLEGVRLDVSLFFCDLRGFTSLSATLEPPDVRAMLNHFYDLTSKIILAHRGTVLKFVGDEVFAAFGAPLTVEDHPQVALDCAMEIQRRASELDTELADLNIPPIKFGIGMNSGEVVAAHIGGGNRRQYDIVGDTVNIGSRLCGQAGKGEIVLPESMVGLLSNPPPMESMGAVALKGLTEPVPLFKVVVGDSEPRQPVPATS
jgi:adenylate cyclase